MGGRPEWSPRACLYLSALHGNLAAGVGGRKYLFTSRQRPGLRQLYLAGWFDYVRGNDKDCRAGDSPSNIDHDYAARLVQTVLPTRAYVTNGMTFLGRRPPA